MKRRHVILIWFLAQAVIGLGFFMVYGVPSLIPLMEIRTYFN